MHSSQNQQQREALFTRLYLEVFPSVSSFISKRGGDLEQARDLFQEALVIYYEQIVLAGQPVQKSGPEFFGSWGVLAITRLHSEPNQLLCISKNKTVLLLPL